MLVYSNRRVPFGISFLVTKRSGISFLESKKQPPEKCVFKSFTNLSGKHLRWSLFLIKLQAFRPLTLLKRDSNTCAFQWICKIFKNTYFEEHLWKTASEIPSFNPHIYFVLVWRSFLHNDEDHIIHYCRP